MHKIGGVYGSVLIILERRSSILSCKHIEAMKGSEWCEVEDTEPGISQVLRPMEAGGN